jgi:peptidoglycan/xylan/chitin deacetylase (PgdA/CDA1 family)
MISRLFARLRSPFFVMPFVVAVVIGAWVLWASPVAPYAYDTVPQSANILPNASFETWDATSPQGWDVTSHGANKALVGKTQGRIDGNGMRVTVGTYSGSDITIATPSASVQPGMQYFFKAFYETNTQLDLLVQKTKRDGRVSTELLRQYPDYDYPWSSMGGSFETAQDDSSVRIFINVTGKGYAEFDAAYIVESGVAPEIQINTQNLLANATWELSVPEGVLAQGEQTPAAKRLEVVSVGSALQASWETTQITASPHELYTFNAEYSATVETEIGVDFTYADGTRSYEVIEKLNPVSALTRVTAAIEIPAGASSFSPSLQLSRNGILTTTNEELYRSKQPASFLSPKVSITFDDGKLTSYLNGAKQLERHGFRGTYYVNPGLLAATGYMTGDNVADLLRRGHQIGSHTNTHIDVTSFAPDYVVKELDVSNQAIKGYGVQEIDFASPYGKHDAAVLPFIMERQSSHRGTETGVNTKQNFNPSNLKGLFMRKEVTDAQLRAYLHTAKNYNGWLILIYHEIEVSDSPFVLDKATLERHLGIIKESGIQVQTVRGAMTQLTGSGQ